MVAPNIDLAVVASSKQHPITATGLTEELEITLSVDSAVYADGDVLAEVQEIPHAFRDIGGQMTLISVTLIDPDAQAGALDLVFFREKVTLGTENGAISITDKDALKFLHGVVIAAADYLTLTNSQVVSIGNINKVLNAHHNSDSLWIGAISRDTKTYAGKIIPVRLGVLWD